MNAKEIDIRQNEPELLKIQFVARMLFNRAELENYFIWGLCAFSAFLGFLESSIDEWIVAIAIILSDIIIFVLEKRMEKDIIYAADLRSMFDRYVFGMPKLNYEEDSELLYETVDDLIQKKPKKYNEQISHTCLDTPPGVKDWYNTNISIPDHVEPAFCFMKENKWWDKKMVFFKNTVYYIIILIIIILAVILAKGMALTDIFVVILGVLGLLTRLVERIIVMYKYHDISVQLDGYVKNYEAFKPGKGLEILQAAIEERRRLPIVHCNAIHVKKVKKLYEKYERINKGRIN